MTGITNADRQRFALLQDLGCIACIIEGEYRGDERGGTPADIHHRINGYRAGHQHTIPLCPWHHRGVPPGSMGLWQTRVALGPSKALEPRVFAEWYGSDVELQARVNQELSKIAAIHEGKEKDASQ